MAGPINARSPVLLRGQPPGDTYAGCRRPRYSGNPVDRPSGLGFDSPHCLSYSDPESCAARSVAAFCVAPLLGRDACSHLQALVCVEWSHGKDLSGML